MPLTREERRRWVQLDKQQTQLMQATHALRIRHDEMVRRQRQVIKILVITIVATIVNICVVVLG